MYILSFHVSLSTCFLYNKLVSEEDVSEGYFSDEGFVKWTDDIDTIISGSPFEEYNLELKDILQSMNIFVFASKSDHSIIDTGDMIDDEKKTEEEVQEVLQKGVKSKRRSRTVSSDYEYMKIKAYVNQ